MAEHTKEPWTVNPLDIGYEDNSIFAPTIGNGQRQLIARVTTGKHAPANARRIVACVNALVGVDTEYLESYVAGNVQNVLQERATLERQRDRLLKAVRQFASADLNDGNCASLDVATKRIRNIARAALAEVEAAK